MSYETENKGWSLVEIIIGVVITAVLLSIFIGPAMESIRQGQSSISYGFHGATETRCIGGYKFVIGMGAQARQILDAEGKGIPCP